MEHYDFLSHAWLRSSLSSLLQHHMAYKCSIPKYGTLIYRYGGDLIHSLTIALGQSNHNPINGSDDDIMLTKVCQNTNSKLHDQINKLLQSDSQQSHKFEHFNLNVVIDDLDPTIWKALCMITQSTNRKLNHVRKVRTLFAVCKIFFIINRQCSFPLHTLIANVVVAYGGSIHLKTLLNRLGVCASSETLARYVQHRVEMRQMKGP